MNKSVYEIKENIYSRFDQKNNMLFRYLWDKKLKSYRNDFAEGMLRNIRLEKEGYTHFDYAFSKASWVVYNRFPFAFSWSGNDTALSIPLAIDAGLGALGRNGLLITPQYGSRVRIGKIFTDLPLTTDEPEVAFVSKISSICQNCFRCAEACENGAISFEPEPVFNAKSISNNSAVKKYYISPEKCFDFWVENNSDCSTCITACPFSSKKRG